MEFVLTAKEFEKLNKKQEELLKEEKEVYSKLNNLASRGINARASEEYMDLKGRAYQIQEELACIRRKKIDVRIVQNENDTFDGVTVGIGTKVTIDYGDEVETYTILAVCENDFINNIISCNTPIAQAVLGKKKGAEVSFMSSTIKIVDVVEI